MMAATPTQPVVTMAGESATLLDALAPGDTGKAELRWTTWTVRNAGAGPLARGQRAVVTHRADEHIGLAGPDHRVHHA